MKEEKKLLTTEELLPIAKAKQTELINTILEEENIDELKNLTHLFNAHQTKRQILRTNALNDVQDALVDQMLTRLNKRPDNFDNSDIASWMKVVQQALDNSQRNISQIDTVPTINVQNNQINIGSVESLSKEERDRVSDVLKQILKSKSEVVDLNDSDIVLDDDTNNSIDDYVPSAMDTDDIDEENGD